MDGREFSKQFGARLRAVREKLGLTRAEVEVTSSGRISAVALKTWEEANRNMPIERLVELAALYRVPPAALLPT
jgi:transcriptional regulator with XRE-family HTH domain